jgi:hypothetical protein
MSLPPNIKTKVLNRMSLLFGGSDIMFSSFVYMFGGGDIMFSSFVFMFG